MLVRSSVSVKSPIFVSLSIFDTILQPEPLQHPPQHRQVKQTTEYFPTSIRSSAIYWEILEWVVTQGAGGVRAPVFKSIGDRLIQCQGAAFLPQFCKSLFTQFCAQSRASFLILGLIRRINDRANRYAQR